MTASSATCALCIYALIAHDPSFADTDVGADYFIDPGVNAIILIIM